MVRNPNWMADRLRFAPSRRFMPVRRKRLLELPDELLLLVLRALMRKDGTQKADNIRDFWNVATTCRRLYVLAMEMMGTLPPWRMVLLDDVPHDVETAMPGDVVQGLLCAVRTGGARLCVLRLGKMPRSHLNEVLAQLGRHSSLTELSFMDTEVGVTVPKELLRRLQCVSIVSPHQRTLLRLRDAGCEPRKLQLFRVECLAATTMRIVWEELTRTCSSVDVTWTNDSLREYSMNCPITDVQHEGMRFRARNNNLLFGVRKSLSMRARGEQFDRGEMFGARTVSVTDWMQCRTTGMWMPTPQLTEGNWVDALTVVIDVASLSRSLLCFDSAQVRKFVDQTVRGRGCDGRIDTLMVTLPPVSDKVDSRRAAELAAELARAVDGVRVLAMSAVVFAELKDVLLPSWVKSVGVVDDFVTSAFVRALPAALSALTTTAGAERSVWVQSVTLRDLGDVARRQMLLRRAEAACRRAEAAGLCAVSVRGAIERWMSET